MPTEGLISEGRFFDFHSLRCQTATLLDAAGVSPRVAQRIMRHSTPGLTDRYTKPRAVDVERAALSPPSLQAPEPTQNAPAALSATGTDDLTIRTEEPNPTEPANHWIYEQTTSEDFASHLPRAGDGSGRNLSILT